MTLGTGLGTHEQQAYVTMQIREMHHIADQVRQAREARRGRRALRRSVGGWLISAGQALGGRVPEPCL